MKQGVLFPVEKARIGQAELHSPKGYRGLAAFHKYWGKKPVECLGYLVESLTDTGEIVLDPFCGYGLLAKETVERNRRFIGIDINPVAIELSRLIVAPPPAKEIVEALREMEVCVKPKIDDSYRLSNGGVATHYLWEGENIKSVWQIGIGRHRKQESEPTLHDNSLREKYVQYRSRHIRKLRFFTNSRINASPEMTIHDLFTGRALRNIDLILDYIMSQPERVRKALLLTLTAASGQMSKMVFAVSRRGKNGGKGKPGISVGSWVIGYWRPKTHFEINVWNCFYIRARKLIRTLQEEGGLCESVHPSSNWSDVIRGEAPVALINDDARTVLEDFPPASVSLVLSDPPHSDRMPYLELSEFWNAILCMEPSFEREIVVSNARERNKGKRAYNIEMQEFFSCAQKVLCDGGIIALMFNAHDSESWAYLRTIEDKFDALKFRGCFPMAYSASSVVQDNRKGSMKYDYVLIFQKTSGATSHADRWRELANLDGWTVLLPEKG